MSWGEGIKLTSTIFEGLLPFGTQDAAEEIDSLTEYHNQNQTFLRDAKSRSGNTPLSPSNAQRFTPPSRATPRRGGCGLPMARKPPLKSIGNDDWSNSAPSSSEEQKETKKTQQSKGKSYGLDVRSSNEGGDNSSSTPHASVDDQAPSLLENELLQTLVLKATHNTKLSVAPKSMKSLSNPRDLYISSDSDEEYDTETADGSHYTYQHDEYSTESDYRSMTSLSNPSYGEMSMATREDGTADHKNLKSYQNERYLKRYLRGIQKYREIFIDDWRHEFQEEQRRLSDENGNSWWLNWYKSLKVTFLSCMNALYQMLSYAEVFIANMPLTIGALGLSWVTQGVIWFKFMEENMDSCTTVHFHSAQCTYPEFPGCFDCDTSNPLYQFVVAFHYFCHGVAGACCLLFLIKCALAWRTVVDELSNPTTSTPCGVVCIAIICVAAGRGRIGEIIVLITSVLHLSLSIWFLYTAIYKYRLLPDPGWFPNTVGIAYAAIKTWLYFPVPGFIFMGICVLYFLATFFIAIYRAFFNHKIAAPVCFISLSAPSITMYAMSIMAQPSRAREVLLETSPELTTRFDELHREIYLPVQHFMFFLCLVGYASALHCLWARWGKFSRIEFSPAHVAFIFPILSHTNAVQAYRSGVDSFSVLPTGHPLKLLLFNYWFLNLVFGTILNFIFTYKYVSRLPRWTKIVDTDFLENEQEPPSPSHTLVHEMLDDEQSHARDYEYDHPTATHVNLAVLQANEAGTLIRVRRGTEEFQKHGPYVRTRNVSSLGFDLILTPSELRAEHAELLDQVARNAPRCRNHTMSIPTMTELRSSRDGADIYGTFAEEAPQADDGGGGTSGSDRHKRSMTWGWT